MRMATTGPSSVSLGLLDGDRVVANLEGPTTERPEVFAQRCRWSYRAAPAAADALAHAGVTAAGLANNHAMDRGPEGLTDTLEALAAASIASTGAGDSAETAATTLLLATSQGTVAENGNAGGASCHPCGIVPQPAFASLLRRAIDSQTSSELLLVPTEKCGLVGGRGLEPLTFRV